MLKVKCRIFRKPCFVNLFGGGGIMVKSYQKLVHPTVNWSILNGKLWFCVIKNLNERNIRREICWKGKMIRSCKTNLGFRKQIKKWISNCPGFTTFFSSENKMADFLFVRLMLSNIALRTRKLFFVFKTFNKTEIWKSRRISKAL